MTSETLLTDIGAFGQDIVQGWLLLLLARRPCHGYDLVDALRSQGIHITDGSYVYRLLRKLDQIGLLQSEWENAGRGGMARRIYSITPAGRDALCNYATAFATLECRLHFYSRTYMDVQRAVPEDQTAENS